jgi:hypothetical protein
MVGLSERMELLFNMTTKMTLDLHKNYELFFLIRATKSEIASSLIID